MTTFDHTNIKNININMNKAGWNPETHDMVLTYDPTKTSKFTIKLVKVPEEAPILDITLAKEVLKKFRP